jgi:CheY-like chemotaxis protein
LSSSLPVSVHFEPELNLAPISHSYFYTQLPSSTPEDDRPQSSQPIGSIVISVTDTGAGLSAEQQQAMLREGVQFSPNDLQSGQGSGLGMWISKEIISLHNGVFRVHSKGLGSGSTFEVILPVYLRPDQAPPTEDFGPEATYLQIEMVPPSGVLNQQIPNGSVQHFASSEISSATLSAVPDPPQPLAPTNLDSSPAHSLPDSVAPIPPAPRVLVVDDVPSCRKIVSRLLRSKGFICNEAENGEVCVNMVLSGDEHYDLIVLDYEMPVMNGPSAAQKLREMKCEVLIVGLTGNVLPEDKEYFLKQGANMVLFKPLNFPELLDYFQQYRSAPGVIV